MYYIVNEKAETIVNRVFKGKKRDSYATEGEALESLSEMSQEPDNWWKGNYTVKYL